MDEQLKWSQWQQVMSTEYDRPNDDLTILRKICIPLLTGLVVAILLCISSPRFACAAPEPGRTHGTLSATRVLIWGLVSALAVAVLSACKVFRSRA